MRFHGNAMIGGAVKAIGDEAVWTQFLASDLACYVTGAALVADGGLTVQTGMPSRIPLP